MESDREWIEKIEGSYDVSTIRYKDILLWPYLRLVIYKRTREKVDLAIPSNSSQLLLFDRIKRSCGALCDFNHKRFRRADALFVTTTDSTKRINNKSFDRFFSGIYSVFGSSQAVVSFLNNRGVKSTPYEDYINCDYLRMKVKLLSKITKIKESNITGREVFDKICEDNGIQIDLIEIIKSYYSWISVFERALKKSATKIVFFVCNYEEYKMALVFAAKRLGIPTVELQHGMFGEEEIFYYKKVDMPYPDYFFVFGDCFKRMLSNSIFEMSNVFVTGYYYLNVIKDNIDYLRREFQKKYNINDKILITVGEVNGYGLEKRLIDLCVALHNACDKVEFIYKPRVITEYLNLIKEDYIHVEYDFDIYTCMVNSDVTLSVHSTCLMESIYLGVPSIGYDFDGLTSHLYSKSWKPETLRIVDSYDGLFKTVLELSGCSKDYVMQSASELYVDNSVARMKEAIKMIDNSLDLK